MTLSSGTTAPVYVVWLPYVQLNTQGNRTFTLGGTNVRADIDTVWQHEIGIDRPDWLNCYRSFARRADQPLGPAVRGTVIYSSDERLHEYARRLVAMIYFLGDIACLQNDAVAGDAAERFYFRTFVVDGPSNQIVEFFGKHSRRLETADRLAMTPPLAARGPSPTKSLDMERPEHVALCQLWDQNPHHRIITACLHYFLAQIDDPMFAPFEQDYANFCAALEATLNVREENDSSESNGCLLAAIPIFGCLFRRKPKSRRTGVFESLLTGFSSIYGEGDKTREFLRGLYTCRSLHAHGISDPPEEETRKQRHLSYLDFLAMDGTYSICRAICRDVILRSLWEHVDPPPDDAYKHFTYTDRADVLLKKLLTSTSTWQEIKSLASESKSAAKIAAFKDVELSNFKDLCDRISEEFDWRFVDPAPAATSVISTLHAMLDAHQRIMGTPAGPPISNLGVAVKNRDGKKISMWAESTSVSEFDSEDTTQASLARACWGISNFFRER